MWRLRPIDLKLRLALRVVALAALCFVAAATYVLFDNDWSARAKMDTIARIVARDLQLVFTMHQNAAYAVQAIRAGARGYVTKSSPPEELQRAIFDVLKGRTAPSADIDHELALSRLDDEPSAVDVLSPREFEVLRLLLDGKTPEEIAERSTSV
jgi:two-component system invasion response regulator UvrY